MGAWERKNNTDTYRCLGILTWNSHKKSESSMPEHFFTLDPRYEGNYPAWINLHKPPRGSVTAPRSPQDQSALAILAFLKLSILSFTTEPFQVLCLLSGTLFPSWLLFLQRFVSVTQYLYLSSPSSGKLQLTLQCRSSILGTSCISPFQTSYLSL